MNKGTKIWLPVNIFLTLFFAGATYFTFEWTVRQLLAHDIHVALIVFVLLAFGGAIVSGIALMWAIFWVEAKNDKRQ